MFYWRKKAKIRFFLFYKKTSHLEPSKLFLLRKKFKTNQYKTFLYSEVSPATAHTHSLCCIEMLRLQTNFHKCRLHRSSAFPLIEGAVQPLLGHQFEPSDDQMRQTLISLELRGRALTFRTHWELFMCQEPGDRRPLGETSARAGGQTRRRLRRSFAVNIVCS